ncbi:unnamed protein product [Laminaria digitata]
MPEHRCNRSRPLALVRSAEPRLVLSVCCRELTLDTHLVPMTFSERTEAEDIKLNSSCASRLAISLSDAAFHLAACGDSIASLNVFGIKITSPSDQFSERGCWWPKRSQE